MSNNRINLSQDFLEQATSANIDNEIVTSGLDVEPAELDQVSKDVAEAVLAAEQEAKANDAVWLFGSRINPPFRQRR
jgi:hypothetical protein